MEHLVLVAVPGEGDSQVATLLAESPGISVRRRCADLAELLAAAAAGLGTVAIVGADLAGFDREAIRHLHASGLVVIALADSPWQHDRMLAIGVDAALAAVKELVPAISLWARSATTAPDGSATQPPVLPALNEEEVPSPAAQAVADVRATIAPTVAEAFLSSPVATSANNEVERLGPGRMLAVWGTTGAPGRTTVAVNLAAELAAKGCKVLLVDADTYGGAVAQVLGLLDEAPGIAAACRAAAADMLTGPELLKLAPALNPTLRILTGISRASRWPELAVGALEAVWAAAREVADYVVVDTGFCVETDDNAFDSFAPQRNQATRAVLGGADEVITVARADVVGIARLVRFLAEDDAETLPAERKLVINQVRRDCGGRDVEATVARFTGVAPDVIIPYDEAVERSRFVGAPLAAVTKTSPALLAIRELADSFEPVQSRRARRRR